MAETLSNEPGQHTLSESFKLSLVEFLENASGNHEVKHSAQTLLQRYFPTELPTMLRLLRLIQHEDSAIRVSVLPIFSLQTRSRMFHRYAQELGTALKKIIVNPQYNDDAVIAAQIFRAVALSPEWIPDLISLLGSQDLSQREAAKIVLLMLDRVPAELELQLVELALGPHLSNEAYIVLQKIATTLTEASILRIASVVHESGHPAGRQAKCLLVRVPKGKKPSEAQIQAFVQSCTNADRTKP